MSTTSLHLVHRNSAMNHHVSTMFTRLRPDAEENAKQMRNSLIRMGIAAASAPALWLAHALTTYLRHGV